MFRRTSILPATTPQWWGRHILIGAFSVLFLLLGIETLVTAYHLNNPHEFIMYFFGSNLMILVSAVGILHCAIRVYSGIKQPAGESRSVQDRTGG